MVRYATCDSGLNISGILFLVMLSLSTQTTLRSQIFSRKYHAGRQTRWYFTILSLAPKIKYFLGKANTVDYVVYR